MLMPPSSVFTSTSRNNSIRRRRWLLLLLLLFSALLHLILIAWGSSQFNISTPAHRQERIIVANLKPLLPVEKPVLLPQPPKRKSNERQRPKLAAKPRQLQPAETPVLDTPIRETVTPIFDVAPLAQGESEPTAGAGSTGNDNAPVAEPASVPNVADEVIPLAGKHYQTNPPPSVELKYNVKALQKGQNYHGSGKITWQSAGGSYTIDGEAGALFITVLDFKSEGEINGFGVAPVTYTQKRFRKPATITTFHRELNTINFSSSNNSYPRTGGEQDRASVVWQLASIARGDTAQFSPGVVIDLFVAGPTDAETWRMQVIGQEQITVGSSDLNAWHIIRVPQPGSHEQRLDIWLAPQEQWYPVKLRFTETDGDYLDMSLSKLKRLDASSPN